MPRLSSASAAVKPAIPPPAISTRRMAANILERMRLTLACGRYVRTQALIDGRVRIEGVDELTYLALRPGETFWRMLNHEEFDASEMSLSSYSILRSEGDTRFIALPVFPSRVFRQNAVYLPADSPIREPRDLKGKRIGVGDYQMTAAVWTRGFLQHEYGVPARELEWVVGRPIRAIAQPAGVRGAPVARGEPVPRVPACAGRGGKAHVRHRRAHGHAALGDRRDRAQPRDPVGLLDRGQPQDAGSAGAVPGRTAAHATPHGHRGAVCAEREPGAGKLLERDWRSRLALHHRVDAGLADDFVLRAGTAGAADRAADLAVVDDQDSAARGDHVVERQQVMQVAFLDTALERLGLTAELRRSARLVLRDRDRAKLRAVHPRKRDEVGAGVDHRNVQFPAALFRFRDRRIDRRLRALERDRGAVRYVVGHLVRHRVARVGLLGLLGRRTECGDGDAGCKCCTDPHGCSPPWVDGTFARQSA